MLEKALLLNATNSLEQLSTIINGDGQLMPIPFLNIELCLTSTETTAGRRKYIVGPSWRSPADHRPSVVTFSSVIRRISSDIECRQSSSADRNHPTFCTSHGSVLLPSRPSRSNDQPRMMSTACCCLLVLLNRHRSSSDQTEITEPNDIGHCSLHSGDRQIPRNHLVSFSTTVGSGSGKFHRCLRIWTHWFTRPRSGYCSVSLR